MPLACTVLFIYYLWFARLPLWFAIHTHHDVLAISPYSISLIPIIFVGFSPSYRASFMDLALRPSRATAYIALVTNILYELLETSSAGRFSASLRNSALHLTCRCIYKLTGC
ncbi:hypothetical protein BKA93DRAFT_788893 [Sparassis latifolia]